MSGNWNEQRNILLVELQTIGSVGRAEGESHDRLPLGFYPVPEHLRMLDPDVVLIVGPRGSGKTEIARVLTDAGLVTAVAQYAPAIRFPSEKTDWKKAYPLDREGFDVGGLRSFLKSAGTDLNQLRELWFTYLVRVLKDDLDEGARTKLDGLLNIPGGNVAGNHRAFRQAATEPLLALDRLDKRLEQEDRFVFVTYDELDTLGAGDWEIVEASIRGLVAFWAAYARRWRRVRAKIFLRTDLYDRHATVGGADLAKLAAGRVELAWNDRDLYALLLKRMANVGTELPGYVRRVGAKIEWTSDPSLGQIPTLQSGQAARPIVERMVGPYMGANRKKGLVYRWLLDHVRDGRGRALPRPFVRLVEEAARQELQRSDSLREPRLFDPVSLRRALDRVSGEYVEQARDEWPWLDAVKECLKGQLVPWERERDVVRLLQGLVSDKDAARRPPFEGRDLLDYLIEVGILRRRPDDRFDAPDLFLSGLGLKRKGGVRRGR